MENPIFKIRFLEIGYHCLTRARHSSRSISPANLFAQQYRPYRFTTNFPGTLGIFSPMNFSSVKPSLRPCSLKSSRKGCDKTSFPFGSYPGGTPIRYGCTDPSIFDTYPVGPLTVIQLGWPSRNSRDSAN